MNGPLRILILAHGAQPSPQLARTEALEHDFIIAVDGAAHTARKLRIAPDVICGDFDSLHIETARVEFPDATFVSTPDQNLADLEKAVRFALEKEPVEITILGALGGRLDHTLGNLSLLLRYSSQTRISLKDDEGVYFALSGSPETPSRKQIQTNIGDTISLIAFVSETIVSVRGVQWELENFPLEIGTHGVSNVAIGDSVVVSVCSGSVFVCHRPSSMQ